MNEVDQDEHGKNIIHVYNLVTTKGVPPNQQFIMSVKVKGKSYLGKGTSCISSLNA